MSCDGVEVQRMTKTHAGNVNRQCEALGTAGLPCKYLMYTKKFIVRTERKVCPTTPHSPCSFFCESFGITSLRDPQNKPPTHVVIPTFMYPDETAGVAN